MHASCIKFRRARTFAVKQEGLSDYISKNEDPSGKKEHERRTRRERKRKKGTNREKERERERKKRERQTIIITNKNPDAKVKFYLPSLNFVARQRVYHVRGPRMCINTYARIQMSNTYMDQGQLYQRLNRILPILFHTNQLQSSSEFRVLFSTQYFLT